MIRFILADLRRLWPGAIAVLFLVALATALGVTVTLEERALRLGSARAADKFDLVVGAAGSETQLVLSSIFLQPAPLPLMPGKTLTKLQSDPRVAWAAPVGFGDSFAGYPVIGTTRTLLEHTAPAPAEGRIFEREGEAVLGAAVNLPLGAEIKPMHGNSITGGPVHAGVVYHVAGRLPPTGTPWDRAILVPIQAVWHVHGLGEEDGGPEHHAEHPETVPAPAGDGHHHHGIEPDAPLVEDYAHGAPALPAILVKPQSVADAYRLRQAYRTGTTVAVFPGEVLTALYATLGDARLVLSAIALGSQALVAAALLLVTITHIGQRRRQIGALRAFGAPRSSVFTIVWLELFLLLALGIGFGHLVGFSAARMITSAFTAQTGIVLPVLFALRDLQTALLLLLGAAMLAALPAVLAYRQSPAKALRA